MNTHYTLHNHFLKQFLQKREPNTGRRLFFSSSLFVDMINLTFFFIVLSEVFGIADVVGINMPNLKILKIC